MTALRRNLWAAAGILTAVLAAGCAAQEKLGGGAETAAEAAAGSREPIQIYGTETAPESSQGETLHIQEPEAGVSQGTGTIFSGFSSSGLYVTGHPVLSSALFLNCNLSTMENIENSIVRTDSAQSIFHGNFIYCQGAAITYVTHTSLDGALYGIILPEEQFSLGCGLRVGMGEEELSALGLPFEKCSKEDYPMDSLYLTDSGCPLNTVEFDSAYVFAMGELPEELSSDNPLFSGGRLSVTALVKDGRVVNVFTDIPVAG